MTTCSLLTHDGSGGSFAEKISFPSLEASLSLILIEYQLELDRAGASQKWNTIRNSCLLSGDSCRRLTRSVQGRFPSIPTTTNSPTPKKSAASRSPFTNDIATSLQCARLLQTHKEFRSRRTMPTISRIAPKSSQPNHLIAIFIRGNSKVRTRGESPPPHPPASGRGSGKLLDHGIGRDDSRANSQRLYFLK
jgi:hypothetical protein